MYISFYLNQLFYSGVAEVTEVSIMMWYQVDFGKTLQFNVYMSEEGVWQSDQKVHKDLIRCVGSEIERHDEEFETEPMLPGKYHSSFL